MKFSKLYGLITPIDYDLLTEAKDRSNFLHDTYLPKLETLATQDDNGWFGRGGAEKTLERLISADPTAKGGKAGKYGAWIIKNFLESYFPSTRQLKRLRAKVGEEKFAEELVDYQRFATRFLDEDVGKVTEDLRFFDRYKNRMPEKDINKVVATEEYDGFKHLYNMVKPVREEIEAEKIHNVGEGDREKVWENENWAVVLPKTQAASCKYGAGTRWCTAGTNDNQFEHYNQFGDLYIIINKQGAKEQKAISDRITELDGLINDTSNLSGLASQIRERRSLLTKQTGSKWQFHWAPKSPYGHIRSDNQDDDPGEVQFLDENDEAFSLKESGIPKKAIQSIFKDIHEKGKDYPKLLNNLLGAYHTRDFVSYVPTEDLGLVTKPHLVAHLVVKDLLPEKRFEEIARQWWDVRVEKGKVLNVMADTKEQRERDLLKALHLTEAEVEEDPDMIIERAEVVQQVTGGGVANPRTGEFGLPLSLFQNKSFTNPKAQKMSFPEIVGNTLYVAGKFPEL